MEFLAEFLDVVRDIVLSIMALGGLLAEIESMIATLGILGTVTPEQVDAFFDLLIFFVGTLGVLLEDIRELPINENSPNYYLYEDLQDAGAALHSYLSTYPWQDPVSIKGEINNCKEDEVVTLHCRDDEEEIPSGFGKRIINDVKINASRKKGDGLFFRNCQVEVTGDMHERQELKTPRFLSYVALGGMLKCFFGFKKKSRSTEPLAFRILQKFLDNHPTLIPILRLLLNF